MNDTGKTSSFNTSNVVDTLRIVVNILNQYHIQYRFMGSIITCALRHEVYRHIDDLDLLIDQSQLPAFQHALISQGFAKANPNPFRVSEYFDLYVYHHPKLLKVTFFAVKFEKSGIATLHKSIFHVTIPKETIKPTNYIFNDIKFVGIPPEVVYKTILFNKHDPKRIKEYEIFTSLKTIPYPGKIYDIKFLGLDFNWLPRTSNSLLEIIGLIRTKFKKSYNPWK